MACSSPPFLVEDALELLVEGVDGDGSIGARLAELDADDGCITTDDRLAEQALTISPIIMTVPIRPTQVSTAFGVA